MTMVLIFEEKKEPKPEDPPISEDEKIKNENIFTYVTTLFCIFTLLNYFRYFPVGWPGNNLMMTINWFAAIASLAAIFFIINKKKLDEKTEKYKTKLLPVLGMLITLAVYTIHTGLLKITDWNKSLIKDDFVSIS
jgi:hypothetical protein